MGLAAWDAWRPGVNPSQHVSVGQTFYQIKTPSPSVVTYHSTYCFSEHLHTSLIFILFVLYNFFVVIFNVTRLAFPFGKPPDSKLWPEGRATYVDTCSVPSIQYRGSELLSSSGRQLLSPATNPALDPWPSVPPGQ